MPNSFMEVELRSFNSDTFCYFHVNRASLLPQLQSIHPCKSTLLIFKADATVEITPDLLSELLHLQ